MTTPLLRPRSFGATLSLGITLCILRAGVEATEVNPISAAAHFLALLSTEQRAKVEAVYEDTQRTRWNFVPMERSGLLLKELNPDQQEELWQFLRMVLSPKGVEEVKGVVFLEGVLRSIENSSLRDPGAYSLLFWGRPLPDSPWGWRFEGHHLSLNVSLVGNQVTGLTPVFLGANPAKVLEANSAGFRNLPLEEDLAWEFLSSLGKEQKQKALIDNQPLEVEGAGQAYVAAPLGAGLEIHGLPPGSKEVFRNLIEAYLDCFNSNLISSMRYSSTEILNDPTLTFQWHGGMTKGEDCSYRICGKTADIQFSNRQNNANHVHVLLRFPGSDFGLNQGVE